MKARISKTGLFMSNYSEEWLERYVNYIMNGELVSKWMIVDSYDKALGFITPKWSSESNSYQEGASENEIQEHLLKRTRDEIKLKYKFHQKNGWEFYQDFRADIVLDLNTSKISLQDAFLIEDFLKVPFNKISNYGDWKTAQFVLKQLITENELLNNYKIKSLNDIEGYILENYD